MDPVKCVLGPGDVFVLLDVQKIIDLFMNEYNCAIGENGKKVAISNFSAEKQGDSLKSFLSSL